MTEEEPNFNNRANRCKKCGKIIHKKNKSKLCSRHYMNRWMSENGRKN